jgi:hypothetical protein
MIPDNLQALFWDIDPSGFDPSAYPDYTIFRVLEYGDLDAFTWLRTMFQDTEIRRIICSERRLSPKSAGFWALLFGIPKTEVAALLDQHSPTSISHE